MTIGIIFFKIKNNKIYIILKKNNNNNKYEDFIISNNLDIDMNIPPLYKININDYNHKILLLNINKNMTLFNKLTNKLINHPTLNLHNKKIKFDLFSLDSFTDDNFNKYLKNKRIKNEEISILLDKIRFNIIIRSKI